MERDDAFPHLVREIEHTTIEMPDGVKLAARVWMPDDAEQQPVPAILEFIPYRKRDFTAERDACNHRWFAGHGYAGVRVDMRGSGESGGVLIDEYIEQEQEDGLSILRWIAAQPWCNGKVGMFGISWGGFNGLQIAARRPPELKAIVSVASTDDRYADDVHYMGGCLLGDNLSWAATMFAYNASPPDPELVGRHWKQMWLDRMEESGLWVVNWLQHQTRDAFWKHGSVCEDFSAIEVPVMAVSGWADGYSNAVFRLLAGLRSPTLGLIGPWSHRYPHQGIPGPPIGFLQECLRWWDKWLKGRETGIMEEPKLRVWMQEGIEPSASYHERPGRWVGEPAWPSPHIREVFWRLGGNGRMEEPDAVAGSPPDESWMTLQSPLSVGQFAGKWCSYSAPPDLPGDQREEDGGSLFWQSRRLEDRLEILGQAVAELEIQADQPVAMVAVRLSDVDPDGKATRVTYGLLNLTHRESHENPEPLVPGKVYRVKVRLNECAHVFSAGHRLRFSLSSSLWPLAWPPPMPTRISINAECSQLLLPVRPPRESESEIRFEPPTQAAGLARTLLQTGASHWKLERDLGTGRSVLEVLKDDGLVRLDEIDLTFSNFVSERYSHEKDDFDSVRGEVLRTRSWRRGGWRASFRARTVMHSDAEYFHISADLDAWIGDRRVFCKSWDEKIRRYLV